MEDNKDNSKELWKKTEKFIIESGKSVGKYFIGKLITSTIIGLVAYVVFKIMGINPAWLLALIVGLTNVVPVFGPWVGLILCALIVIFINPIFALYTSLVALLLQLLEQFVLLPLIVGKAVDLKPLLIICVLIIGSMLFGFWGVVFAIPIAAVIKIGYGIFIKNEKKEDEKT